MLSQARHIIKSLQRDDSILVLPADKGRAMVVMDVVEYDKKMNSLLTDSQDIQETDHRPHPSLERKMNEILLRLQRSGSITSGLYDKLRSLMGSLPMLYRLPKVHKPEVPLRPIMSFLWSPTYQLSKHLATILTPCRELIKPQVLTSDELLVSFNVVLLRSCTSCYRSSTAQTQG